MLINFENIKEYIQCNAIDEEKLNKFINDAENIDIKNFLGNNFYYDIINNLSNYDLILNGGEIEINNNKGTLQGLKKALCYFAYSRYIKNGVIQVTATGVGFKNSENLSNFTYKELQSLGNEYKIIGDSILNEIKSYFDCNTQDFELFFNNSQKNTYKNKIVVF